MTEGKDAGYLTLEAIVAMTIVALVLISFEDATSLALRAAARANALEDALDFGKSKLAGATFYQQIPDETGKLDNGSRWTLRTKHATGQRSGGSASADWVVFEVTDPSGQQIIRLQTIVGR